MSNVNLKVGKDAASSPGLRDKNIKNGRKVVPPGNPRTQAFQDALRPLVPKDVLNIAVGYAGPEPDSLYLSYAKEMLTSVGVRIGDGKSAKLDELRDLVARTADAIVSHENDDSAPLEAVYKDWGALPGEANPAIGSLGYASYAAFLAIRGLLRLE